MGVVKKGIVMLVLFLIGLSGGCRSGGGYSFYMSEEIDFSFIQRVAVLPLENLTEDRFAGEVVRQVVISELLATNFMEVVVSGDVLKALAEMGIEDVTALDAQQIKALGKKINVQGVILGSVEKFGEEQFGDVSAPVVTITLLMADTSSGSIIWSVTRTRGGANFWARHFGARSETMSETLIGVVREAFQTLYAY